MMYLPKELFRDETLLDDVFSKVQEWENEMSIKKRDQMFENLITELTSKGETEVIKFLENTDNPNAADILY